MAMEKTRKGKRKFEKKRRDTTMQRGYGCYRRA